MNFGEIARTRLQALFPLLAAVAVFALPQAAMAQEAGAAAAPVTSSAEAPAADAAAVNAADPNTPPAAAAEGSTAAPAADGAASGYTPLGPEMIKGQPVDGGIGFQPQYSADGRYAEWMHNWVLLPVIIAISVFVLVLLLLVVVRYRKGANPVPSKTSHNTLIEVIWTVVPALVLVAIAFPSMILLSRQYKSPPENAVTIKVTGYQWYWGYTYPDNGGFEVISNMLPEEEAIKRGEPSHLAADNRMVVPVGVPLRIQTTGADVIHAFAVPSLWFKIDAVPGRLNERMLTVTEPGIYYGQCSELCGARHGYMPITVEAVPQAQFEAWLRSKGGTVGGEAAAAALAAAPAQEPESSVEGAPGAGAAPTGAASAAPEA